MRTRSIIKSEDFVTAKAFGQTIVKDMQLNEQDKLYLKDEMISEKTGVLYSFVNSCQNIFANAV